MKVHAFKLYSNNNTRPLPRLLARIATDGLTDRIKLVNSNEIRIDSIEQDGDFWLMDFVKFRNNAGPGRTHRARETEGFVFGDGECFGEETGVLFNPDNNYMIIQYNHHGVRSGSVEEYFNKYDHGVNGYELTPKYDEDVIDKFNRKTNFRKLEFSIASRYMTADDRRRGVTLDKALEMGSGVEADRIKVTMSAVRENRHGLSFDTVVDTVNGLRGMLGGDNTPVKRLEVSGRDSDETPVEVLDFIGQRLCLSYEVSSGADLRMPRNDRWSLLKDAHRNWQELLI